MKDINDIMQERGELVEQLQAITAKHEGALPEDAQVEYDRIDAAQEGLKAQADRLQKEAEAAHDLATAPKAQKIAFEKKEEGRNSPEYKAALLNYIRKGQYSNALEVGTAGEGGNLTHDSFDMNFREIRDDYNALRPYVETIMTSGDHKIRVESSLGTSTWTAEEAAYTESDPAFGLVTLNDYKLGRIVKVTEELLQDSDFDIESYLARAFGRSNGLAEEAAFIDGTGSGQPTGLITGAGDVGSTETTVTEEALYDLYFGLNRVYRGNATFIFNDLTVKAIRKIENGSGDKIWQPSLVAGEPDRVLGRPFITSAYMPDGTESPNEVIGIFGDLSCYAVADRAGFSIKRLDELYAANGFVGFKGYARTDGKVVQAAGIKSLTLA